jgi:nucleoid-associated protein YgaU
MNPKGEVTRCDYDCFRNVCLTWFPDGQEKRTEFDINRQPVYEDDQVMMVIKRLRDYFGNESERNDKSGAVIKTQRNFTQQPVKVTSSGGNHGEQYGPDGNKIPVPGQELNLLYDEAGHLKYLLDDALDFTSFFTVNEKGVRIGERFTAADGHVYQDIQTILNACDWITDTFDTRIRGLHKYDPKSNRRMTEVFYSPDLLEPPLISQYWFAYTAGDLVKIDRGVLKDGVIQITDGQGTELAYDKNGWRSSQTVIKDGVTIKTTLEYLNNGLLQKTSSTNGAYSSYSYDKASRRVAYSSYTLDDKTKKWHTHDETYEWTGNGWLALQTVSEDGKLQSTSEFSGFLPTGEPQSQKTQYYITPKECYLSPNWDDNPPDVDSMLQGMHVLEQKDDDLIPWNLYAVLDGATPQAHKVLAPININTLPQLEGELGTLPPLNLPNQLVEIDDFIKSQPANIAQDLTQIKQTLYDTNGFTYVDITDLLTLTYLGFDSLKIQQDSGVRMRKDGINVVYGTIYATYDANGNLQCIEGATKDGLRDFLTNSEGRVVLKTNGELTNQGGDKHEWYFYTPDGEPYGRFGDIPDSLLAFIKSLSPVHKTQKLHKKGEQKKEEDYHWYHDDELKNILHTYLSSYSEFEVLEPMLGNDWQGEEGKENTLQNNLIQFKNQREELILKGTPVKNKIIVPVNLNNSHWVLLYLVYSDNPSESPTIHYFDSLGNPIPVSIDKAFKNPLLYPEASIQLMNTAALQQDSNNCGPWVIEAARAIARGETLDAKLDIAKARQEHQVIHSAKRQPRDLSSLPPEIRIEIEKLLPSEIKKAEVSEREVDKAEKETKEKEIKETKKIKENEKDVTEKIDLEAIEKERLELLSKMFPKLSKTESLKKLKEILDSKTSINKENESDIRERVFRHIFQNFKEIVPTPSEVDFDLNFLVVSDKFPPPTPLQYTAQAGETFADIAERMYGDRSKAGAIARANGYNAKDVPPVGRVLSIPVLVSDNDHNWEGIYEVYNLAGIMGNLYPVMAMPVLMPPPPPPPPPPSPPWWKEVLEITAGIAIIACLPGIGAALAASLGTFLGYFVAGATLGALSDFASQETGRLLGMQKNINWKEVGDTALLTGLTAGIGGELTEVEKTSFVIFNKFATNIVNALATNAALQVVSEKLHLQKGFNWKELAAAAAIAAFNGEIDDTLGVDKTTGLRRVTTHPLAFAEDVGSETVADGFITAKVEHQSMNVAMESAQAIGTFVGYEMDGLAKDIYLGSKPNQELPEETGHKEAKVREQQKMQEQKQQKIPAKPWQAAMLTEADLNGFDEVTGKGLSLPDLDSDEIGSSTSQTHYTATHAANKVQAAHGQQATQGQSRAQRWNAPNVETNNSSSFWKEKAVHGVESTLSGIGKTSEKLLSYWGKEASDNYHLAYLHQIKIEALDHEIRAALADFNLGKATELSAVRDLEEGNYSKFFQASKSFVAQADKYALGPLGSIAGPVVGIASSAIDISEASPQDQGKTAFVDGAALVGSEYGGSVGTSIALGEEVIAPIVSTPLAIATAVGSVWLGGEIARVFAEASWDVGEATENYFRRNSW